MDEKMGCDICGEIPLNYNLDSHHIRNSLVKKGIRKWLFCDECVVIIDGFVNNLQALRPNKIVDNWPIPEDIADAADVTCQERRARIEKKPEKSEYVRKADFVNLEKRFWKFRETVLNEIEEIVKQLHANKGAYSDE